MIVRESIEFKRGQDTKRALNVGLDVPILNFLDWVSNDFQMNPKDPGYLGYINIALEDFTNSELADGFKKYVANWEKYKKDLKLRGIGISSAPDLGETIFYQLPNHKWWDPDPTQHTSTFRNFVEHLLMKESLVAAFVGRHSGEPIGIFKNPARINRYDAETRALSDREGNLWVSNVADTTHSEMMEQLSREGEIGFGWYTTEDNESFLDLAGWQRKGNTNEFYVGETFNEEDIIELRDQLHYMAEMAHKKNPQFEFFGDISILDA